MLNFVVLDRMTSQKNKKKWGRGGGNSKLRKPKNEQRKHCFPVEKLRYACACVLCVYVFLRRQRMTSYDVVNETPLPWCMM